ncbi:MAG: indolepyruvate oxidoreductase subunit beta family protein [Lysobacterales bacterium]
MDKPFKIAISALGGQGGGVLSGWIVDLGQRCGYIAQSTSVPGVAQRTGATVYYVELFPESVAKKAGCAPVLSLMPVPGDVDIVLASEVMEAGRALQRGIVTEQTTLIASTHRVYAIGEKIQMGDGRESPSDILEAVKAAAGKVLLADMEACAQDARSIISSVLFGALAGSGSLPFERDDFEAVIRDLGRAVESNLAGFAAGFDAVTVTGQQESEAIEEPTEKAAQQPDAAPAVRPLLARLTQELPPPVQSMARMGLEKVVDHSGLDYGQRYLDRLVRVSRAEGEGDYPATTATARYLALAMAFEDTIRVAELKTRSTRFARFRKDVVAQPEQIVRVTEYMHPRVEEFCDLLPPVLARWVLGSKTARRLLGFGLGKGRRIPTTSLRGYLPLYFLSSLKFWRPYTYKFAVENDRIERWLSVIDETVVSQPELAAEIAGLQRLIKGYGETHERGLMNYQQLLDLLPVISDQDDPSTALRELRDAALKDEEGEALSSAIAKLSEPAQAA